MILLLALCLCLLFCNSVTAIASDLDEETNSALIKAEELASPDAFTNILKSFCNGITSSVKSFSSVFAAMLFTTFLLGITRLAAKSSAVIYAGNICLCAFSFSVVANVTKSISSVLDSLQAFMLSALPAMTTLYSMSGAPASAAVNYGTTLLLLNLCNAAFTSVIIPGVKCITVLSVIGFVSESFDYSGFSAFVKNTVGWMFGILMAVMASVIAFQNVVAASKDGLMGRTVRFAASRFIPVIGNTVSESARTISESLRLVRCVTGVGGIFAVIGIIASPIAAILVCRFFLGICAGTARLFSCNKASLYLTELSGIMNLLMGAVIGISLVLIMILGIFARSAFGL